MYADEKITSAINPFQTYFKNLLSSKGDIQKFHLRLFIKTIGRVSFQIN